MAPLFNFVITSLPIIAGSFLVFIRADEKIITKFLKRNVITCHSQSAKHARKWDCASEISRENDYLGLNTSLALTFIIGALLITNDWIRAGMVFFGVGVIVFYLANLFVREEPEKPVKDLTKYASMILATIYLTLGLLVHYFLVVVL